MAWTGSKNIDDWLNNVAGKSTTPKKIALVLIILLVLGLIGFIIYHFWQYIQKFFAPPSSTTTTPLTPLVYHTSVINPAPDDPKPAPPGGFTISSCDPAKFHEHVAKDYQIYATLKPHKAFVTNNACSQVYYTHSQADDHTATQLAFASCQQREPGRCGVVAVNDVVYSHT